MMEKLKPLYNYVKKKNPTLGNTIHNIYYSKTISKKVKGKNNIIKYKGASLNSIVFDIIGDNNSIIIEEKSILYGVKFFIRGNRHKVHIGSECQFTRGSNLWFEDEGCVLEIGMKSTFEDIHIAVTEPGSRVTIGSDCMFAYDIDIRTGDSHSIIDASSGKRVNFAKDVNIGNHVWVAAHSIILKGVSIEENCVIATHSVITKSIDEKGVIVGGNPGEIIKRNINWTRQRINKLS